MANILKILPNYYISKDFFILSWKFTIPWYCNKNEFFQPVVHANVTENREKEKSTTAHVCRTHNFQCETWRTFIVGKVISPKISFSVWNFNDERNGMIGSVFLVIWITWGEKKTELRRTRLPCRIHRTCPISNINCSFTNHSRSTLQNSSTFPHPEEDSSYLFTFYKFILVASLELGK